MRRRNVLAALVGAAALVLVPVTAQGANGHANYRAVCPGPPAGYARCHVLVVTDSHGKPVSNATPTGLSPATIQSVYGFPAVGDPTDWSSSANAGHGETIAIVDAYDDPYAESDLGVFSGQFGLPPCTTANGCFTKVNQKGGTSYPRANSGWGLEISLDIQWAHAIAPGARILLVEASSNSFSNLLTAESYAATPAPNGGGASYVSNSWGGSEFNGETSYDPYFSQPGVSYFVSAGDSGLPAEYPSASPNVISVGGTTLHFSGSTFTGETGWSSGGGGCSAYESATPAQQSFLQYGQVNCGGKRATPDVSLDADPNSGVSVYDSYGYGGWLVVGGTSASSPMWAAASADSGAPVDSSWVYTSGSGTFRDISSGNNGAPCLTGYDLCSGRGSWLYGGGSTQTAGFTISASTPQSVVQGKSTSSQVTVTPVNSYAGTVNLSLSNPPTGVSSQPASVTVTSSKSGSTTLTIDTTSSTSSGTYTLTITGTDSTDTSLSSSTTVSLTVTSASTSVMTVTVAAGKVSQKGPNYHVPLTVTATDGSSAISGAGVTLDVYSGTYSGSGSSCPGTLATTGTGTTGSTGQVSFDFRTRSTGDWCAVATVNATGYSTGIGATGFTTP